ncbi:MAG: ATP-dependent DNA helicase RecG [Saprospiraceae bacterium]|jgi:ATP-dependent DNA helicase RecG|nr:ATP-dependent DNA helicase RecG [Saprospiraceae bacterium]
MTQGALDTSIEFLKGVGPKKAELLNKELGIFTFRDLLMHFPFRYVDKTQFHHIRDLREDSGTVQLKGILRRLNIVGDGRKKRLSGRLRDETGYIDLVWFTGIHWLEKQLSIGSEYVVYGRVSAFRNQLNIAHPEMEQLNPENIKKASSFAPVYPSTDKLNTKGLEAKARRKIMQALFEKITAADLPDNLPAYLIQKFRFPSRHKALRQIHFPRSQEELTQARNRLKFEELFFLQLRLLQIRKRRKDAIKGWNFEKIGDFFNTFFKKKLPFELTTAQKRVLKEIRRDLGSAIQMNRLLQGDVGSGKTIVGLMSMLMALDNNFQACLMAPTEILAQQHFQSISEYCEGLDINVGFLSGSVKGKKRKAVLEGVENGSIHILIGTHALIEPSVVFKNLGLAITDEQHRFGVAQRAKLWAKNTPYPPHVLVMTATPIPRTLAMTLYGDLDVSVIDELPPGRKAIQTMHKTENHRMRVIGFMREEIAKGRQVYIVYPLIEESEKLDLQNLQDGYESISREFPPPNYQISIVHGRMKAGDKDFEMQRFVNHETQIMIATTVIEVGVNVPNASVMVIENTERFGLSQLHQLRGRVGRGADQSYCILMSSFKLSKEGKERIQTMVRTNNGFEIAEADLKLRGPGNMEGTQQSGILNFRIADLSKDGKILKLAREIAARILENDQKLEKAEHQAIRWYLEKHGKKLKAWSRIS